MEIEFSITEKELLDYHSKSLLGIESPSIDLMFREDEINGIRGDDMLDDDNDAEEEKEKVEQEENMPIELLSAKNHRSERNDIGYFGNEEENNDNTGNTISPMNTPSFLPGANPFFMQKSLVDYSRFNGDIKYNGSVNTMTSFDGYFKARNRDSTSNKSKSRKKRKKSIQSSIKRPINRC